MDLEEYLKQHRSFSTGLTEPIADATLLLTALGKGEPYAAGTAVIIGPHLALTAKHVMEECWHKNELGPMEAGVDASHAVLAAQFHKEGTEAKLYSVTHCWTNDASDLAVLFLEFEGPIDQDHQWWGPCLGLLPPKVGAGVSAFGYPNSRVTKGETATTLELHGKSFHGEVTGAYPNGFTLTKNHCFTTSLAGEGGASGGPVFDETGCVRGIVSTSMLGDSTGDPPYTIVTPVYLALGIELSGLDERISGGGDCRLLDLVDRGMVFAKDAEFVVRGPGSAVGLSLPSTRYMARLREFGRPG